MSEVWQYMDLTMLKLGGKTTPPACLLADQPIKPKAISRMPVSSTQTVCLRLGLSKLRQLLPEPRSTSPWPLLSILPVDGSSL